MRYRTLLVAAMTLVTSAVAGLGQGRAESPSWMQAKAKTALGSSYAVSETPWSAATFNTSGPRFTLWYVASPRGGRAAIILNGKAAGVIDMYSPKVKRASKPFVGRRGNNTVQFVVLAERNPASAGWRVNLDAFSPTRNTCARGCRKNPPIVKQQAAPTLDGSVWYPASVPDNSSRAYSVAVGSYVRGADVAKEGSDYSFLRQAACAQARAVQRGVVILSFGKQTATGASGFGKTLTNSKIIAVTAAWASGLAECADGAWEVAIGTSNSGGATLYNGYSGGAAWASLVAQAQAASDPRVSISGSVDLEPGWGPSGQARAWVDGYVATTTTRLWNFGSADGCPQTYLSKLTCNNGWTVDDVIWVSSRAGASIVVRPQLHTQSGSQARQWAVLAARAVATGEPLRIAGVGVQTAACSALQKGCPTTGESAWDAWTKLRSYLDANTLTAGMPLGVPSDIRWGWGSAIQTPPKTTVAPVTTTSPPASTISTTTSTTTTSTTTSTTTTPTTLVSIVRPPSTAPVP
jgi:hypothetical protein